MYGVNQLKPDKLNMNNKYISKQSGRLLSFVNERDIKYFNYKIAKEALPEAKDSTLRELLRDMTRRGLLMRIKRGIYHVIPYEEDSETYIPDWHVLTKYLVGNIEAYIGYYSALQVHNLITQPSLKEQIVVSKQIHPSTLEIKRIQFQFIYHNKKHFFGMEKIWIDDYNKVNCSDLEKTFIDCLFKPDYAGGIVEIARSLYISRDKINFKKLFEYIIKFDSQAVIKRLGFLLDILEIKTDIIDELKKIKTKSVVLLDTELPNTGKISSKWSIKQNIDSETIKSAIYT